MSRREANKAVLVEARHRLVGHALSFVAMTRLPEDLGVAGDMRASRRSLIDRAEQSLCKAADEYEAALEFQSRAARASQLPDAEYADASVAWTEVMPEQERADALRFWHGCLIALALSLLFWIGLFLVAR